MMRLRCTLWLPATLLAFAGSSHAQTYQAIGVGSSALFLEVGEAAYQEAGSAPFTAPAHIWTHSGGTCGAATAVCAVDNRDTTNIPAESGNAWIVWDSSTPPNIWAYVQTDSTVGDRLFAAVDSSGNHAGKISVPSGLAGTAGSNLLSGVGITDESLPSSIQSAVDGQLFSMAGTDIRLEDARFATARALRSCGTTIDTTYGLGYQGAITGIGVPIAGYPAYGGNSFNVIDFASGLGTDTTDPISGGTVAAKNTVPLGAAPVLVLVNKTGSAWSSISNISSAALSGFLDGTLSNGSYPSSVVSLVREGLSGTYNTMEYNEPNTTVLGSSQEGLLGTDENCSGGTVASNPLDVTQSGGNSVTRRRVIGTGNMVNTVRDVTNAIGYSFWSFSGVANCLANCKYLTVDGVDPIKDSYSDGTIPDLAHAGDVTFSNIGSYPIWSVLRVFTDNPTPSSIVTLISDAQSYTSSRPDFIPAGSFNYVRSHFVRIGLGPAANGSGGDCTDPESGGDVGGVVYTIAADQAYCTSMGVTTGQTGQRR